MNKVLFVLAALSVTVISCSKKNELVKPGAAPTPVAGEETKPGVKPEIVEQRNSILGTWESPCVKEQYTTNPQPHVTQYYDSYRYFLKIEDGVMTEKLFRFVGDHCRSYDFSIEIGTPKEWKYVELKQGAVDGAAWEILYTDYNNESLGEGELGTAAIVSSPEETIQFDGDGIDYVRAK